MGFLNLLMKAVLVPIWMPLMLVWIIAIVISAPARMYLHDDDFWGGNVQEGERGWIRGFAYLIILPYSLPAIMFVSLLGILTKPFRIWIFDGFGE